MSDISTAAKRARLKRQREPHWQKLSKGVYLGYRVGDSNTWRARVRDLTGGQQFDSLDLSPELIELANGDEFTAAKKLCEAFAATIIGNGVFAPKLATVADAIDVAYLQWMAKQGRDVAARSIRSKLGTCLFGNGNRPADPLASVKLHKATDADFRGWHDRLGALDIQPQTKNNYMKWVKAGLERARKAGYVCNPTAWACLERFPEGAKESSAYLSQALRTEFLRAIRLTQSGDAAADFARGMYAGGARPIDAARAKVGDFDAKNGTLTCYTQKGRDRTRWRPYIHPLTPADVAWLKEITRGKLPTAYLFATPEGGQWTQKKWNKAFSQARAMANEGRNEDDPLFLPATVRANSWRHSKITDLLVYEKRDSVLVAAECGTSTEMICETYYHCLPKATREALSMLACAA